MTAQENSRLDRWAPRCLSILRIVAALLFMEHGTQKLFTVPAMGGAQPVALLTMSGAAGILEFFGGMLLCAGLFTRSVAFILSGMMAYAYFVYHAGQNLSPLMNRGELAVLYSFTFFYLFTSGGGSWSLDALLRARKPGPAAGSA